MAATPQASLAPSWRLASDREAAGGGSRQSANSDQLLMSSARGCSVAGLGEATSAGCSCRPSTTARCVRGGGGCMRLLTADARAPSLRARRRSRCSISAFICARSHASCRCRSSERVSAWAMVNNESLTSERCCLLHPHQPLPIRRRQCFKGCCITKRTGVSTTSFCKSSPVLRCPVAAPPFPPAAAAPRRRRTAAPDSHDPQT